MEASEEEFEIQTTLGYKFLVTTNNNSTRMNIALITLLSLPKFPITATV